MSSTSHFLYLTFVISVYYNQCSCFVLNKLTTSQVQKISNWTPDDKENIWELSGQLEGDIVIDNNYQRNVLNDNTKYWPGKIIPFEIDSIFSEKQKNLIEEAVKQFEKNSCFIVRPKIEADTNYVYITGESTGCWAYLGFQGGIQYLNLQRNACLGEGTIIHEFLHSIGFLHQHSSWNRDDHVKIFWENIQKNMWYNFEKSNQSYTTNFGLSYDYGSILHYSAYAFTENGEPTIMPKVANVQIGQRLRMSDIDIAKLNKFCEYSTTEEEIPTTTVKYSTTVEEIQTTTIESATTEEEMGTTITVESTTSKNVCNRIQVENYFTVSISICMIFVIF